MLIPYTSQKDASDGIKECYCTMKMSKMMCLSWTVYGDLFKCGRVVSSGGSHEQRETARE
eukprot:735365-Amphidinium_carterae.1